MLMIQTGYKSEQIIERLRFDNPWWTSGGIDPYYNGMRRRIYLDKLYSLVSDTSIRRSVILMGPRRVGKTVLIFHTIQQLISQGVNAQKIIYISIETPIYTRIALEDLFDMACRAVGSSKQHGGFYVFFDEIQYLKDWEVHLKSLVDSYHSCKFTASGSAAAALKLKSQESGAGRFTDFHLPPLTFCEYIHLKDLNSLILPQTEKWGDSEIDTFGTINIALLNKHFVDYLNFGGYPEVVFSERIRSNPAQFIRHDIIDKVLLCDLPSLYGVADVQELNAFFSVIAYHSGNEFSFENLSKISGVKKETLRKYLEYLQAAFLVKMVNKTDINAKHFQRVVSFKIYLTNPSLRCALFQPLQATDDKMGDLVETAVFAQLFPRNNQHIYYANWKEGKQHGEVDIVGINAATQKPQWATEVKWTNRYYEHYKELKSLLNFVARNKLQRALVTTIDKQGIQFVNGVTLNFIPVSLYAYRLGYNTVHEQNNVIEL